MPMLMEILIVATPRPRAKDISLFECCLAVATIVQWAQEDGKVRQTLQLNIKKTNIATIEH